MIKSSNNKKINKLLKQWGVVINKAQHNSKYKKIMLKKWKKYRDNNINHQSSNFHSLSKSKIKSKRKANKTLITTTQPFMEDISLSLLNIPHMIFLADKDAWSIELTGNLTGKGIGLGRNYSTQYVGSNIIDTTLKQGKPYLIYGIKNHIKKYQYLCCLSMPIQDKNNKIIATLNVFIPIKHACPQNLIIVLTVVKAIEAQLISTEKFTLTNKKSIGEKIRKIRKKKSLSQTKVATETDIAQSFLSDIENGKKSPTLRSIKLIAQALNVPATDLIV